MCGARRNPKANANPYGRRADERHQGSHHRRGGKQEYRRRGRQREEIADARQYPLHNRRQQRGYNHGPAHVTKAIQQFLFVAIFERRQIHGRANHRRTVRQEVVQGEHHDHEADQNADCRLHAADDFRADRAFDRLDHAVHGFIIDVVIESILDLVAELVRLLVHPI